MSIISSAAHAVSTFSHSKIGRIAEAGVGVGALALVLSSCSEQPQGIETEAQDNITRFDQNGDGKLDLQFESTKSKNVDNTTFISDGDGGGYYTHNSYTEMRSIAALLQASDAVPNGNADGTATFDEMTSVMRTYDAGDTRAKPEYKAATVGNGVLEGSELDAYRTRFPEVVTHRN